MALEIAGVSVLLISVVVGIAFVFFGFPGTYILLFGALLYDLITWSLEISPAAIIGLVILVAFGEVFSALVNVAGKKLSSSFIGNAGALLGSIGGAALGSWQGLTGILVGIPAGGAFGAFLFELVHYFSISQASRASFAAFFGRVMGIFVKFEVSVVMLMVIAISLVI